MADFDLAKRLQDLGVPEDIATNLETSLDGRDLVDLVNALNDNNIGTGIRRAGQILAKYGVTIQEGTDMDHKAYLNALLASASRGESASVAVENIVGEWLKPIHESNDPVAALLALEGYNYCTNVGDKGDLLIDWLEDNQVDYQTDGSGNFQIRCADREGVYRVGSALNKIMGKVVERVSEAPEPSGEETIMSEKKSGKSGMPVVKDRNVSKFAAAKMSKVSGGAHKSELRKAVDSPLDRKAKHKGIPAFESIDNAAAEEYAIGEEVRVGENVGTVKIPHGPNGTVGVVCDGVLEMVEASEVSRLDEGVLGVTSVAPLFRLRELAGLPPTEMKPETPLVPEVGDDKADVGTDEVGDGFDDSGIDASASDDFDLEQGNDLDFDTSMDASVLDDPLAGDDAGVPGSIGSDPLQSTGVAPVQSEAYGSIEDHLNNIQSLLGDIKLSEYKGLVKKLEDLAGQVRLMGRDYLGERRRK